MRTVFLVMALAGTVAACDRIPGTDQHAISAAQLKAAENLRDPLAAQFRRVKLVQHPPTADSKAKPDRFVCGEMNAKNAYGGYIGFSRFFVDIDREVVALDPQVEATQEDVEESLSKCRSLMRNPYAADMARSYCNEAQQALDEIRKQIAFNDGYQKSCSVEPATAKPTATPKATAPATPAKKN